MGVFLNPRFLFFYNNTIKTTTTNTTNVVNPTDAFELPEI